jgi:cytochrome c oxidase subunit III
MKTSIEDTKPILTVNKWKFMIWLFIIGSVMFFASQTSAYLVRRAEGNWKEFELPQIFFYSTGVLLISSVFMHLAYLAAKKDNFINLKIFISLCFSFGLLFLGMQFMGWQELGKKGIYFIGNPSESFYFVITIAHAVHLFSGLCVLTYSFWSAHNMRIHSKNLVHIEVSAIYWHFLDILWVYLLVFLIYFR